jgi:hypothetical protein
MPKPLVFQEWEEWFETRISTAPVGLTTKLYTNGVLAVSGAVTIAPANFNPALNFLGQSQYPADPSLNEALDEFYMYNYALSDTEIARLSANQPPPPTTPTAMSFSASGNELLLS